MRNENICKFISPTTRNTLDISCFILESDKDVIKAQTRLKEHRVILVAQGEGNFYFDGTAVPFAAGSLVFGFKDECFFADAENCEYMYISFDGARAEELFLRFGISGVNRTIPGFDGLLPLWRESLSRASHETIDLAAESILLYTFSRLFGGKVKQNSVINEIVKITEEQFTDSELSIASLANTLGYNAKYLSHLFKDKMGVGYSEYLRTLRLKFAVSLFDRGIESVKNVALLSGFSDPLYFSSVFKTSIGLTPKEYKNQKTL